MDTLYQDLLNNEKFENTLTLTDDRKNDDSLLDKKK